MSFIKFGLVALLARFMTACCGPRCEFEKSLETPVFTGGGQDMLLTDLPFESGYDTLCTQGAYGVTSHNAKSTRFDVDLDTPNDQDIPVFVPVGGVAYVHDQNPDTGFGIHVNVDLGDGTYLIIAHLSAVFVNNESEVTVGQLLGYEGTTGNSFGDHVHFGRHAGDASRDGTYGESFDGLTFDMFHNGERVQLSSAEMVCGLPGGATYTSDLQTALWHPNGSLVKTPDNATVYLLEDRGLTPFLTEDALVSRNLSYTDVALISDSELSCYGMNPGIGDTTSITAVYGNFPNQAVWLLVGSETDPERYRLLVPERGWQAVLKSWGISVSTYDDLYQDAEHGGVVDKYTYAGLANFRNGSLVSPISDSAVYVMSDNVAMPIKTWDIFLLSGWEDRRVIELEEEDFDAIVTVKGDCGTNTYCLSLEDVQTCGGPSAETEGVNEQIADGDPLILTWFTPDNREVDSITLMGAMTRPGLPEEDWGTVFNEVQNTNTVTATVPSAFGGDRLRLSVEYRDNGIPSWSCLAPYPPGLLQGSAIVQHGGSYLSFELTDDPMSDGCGLSVEIP